jgi:hypothetical protein
MDMMSMVTGILAAQAANTQQQVATTIMSSNAGAEKSAVETLLGTGTPSLANVASGSGGNINVTA